MVKTRFVGIVFCWILATSGWAATTSPSLIATPPQPKWSELTVQQKIILAPLSDDWDSLEYYRQKKWLTIVTRFPAMAPEEQGRIQEQMQEWGKLTPEDRRLARENFKTANQLPSKKKQELKQKWEEYSNLPEAEKEKLKQQATSKPAPKPGLPAASLIIPAPTAALPSADATHATDTPTVTADTPTVAADTSKP